MQTIKEKNEDHSRLFPLLAAALRRLLPFLLLTILLPLPARASEPTVAETVPSWLEPRGLSIVDLVGLVPESHLQGSIVRFAPGLGLAVYEWGRRSGDFVTVRVHYRNQYPGVVWCLGKPGERDEWPVAVPASTARFYQGSVDITRRLAATFTYTPAGLVQPTGNTNGLRYPLYTALTQINGVGEAVFPANTGCQFILDGTTDNISAEFTFRAPQIIQVQALGSQTGSFQSYIGPGASGQLRSLQSQMRARFDDRHSDMDVTPPAGTNYVLVRYPLMPVDPWGRDLTLPGAGTYRVRRSDGRLSVDHINTMGIPYYGQWQDADQSGGSTFLPYFTDSVALSSPEYFLPEGFSYAPCMTYGGCSGALLDAIYGADMTMTAHFYNVLPLTAALTPIPLRMVGPSWTADAGFAQEVATTFRVFLPLIARQNPAPPVNPATCPCGWFTDDGRMVGFIPRPS